MRGFDVGFQTRDPRGGGVRRGRRLINALARSRQGGSGQGVGLLGRIQLSAASLCLFVETAHLTLQLGHCPRAVGFLRDQSINLAP